MLPPNQTESDRTLTLPYTTQQPTTKPTALHYLEYESLFGPANTKATSSSKKDAAVASEASSALLDGTWRLAFNSAGAFPLKGARQDRWGYLKDEVEVRIINQSIVVR